MKKLMFLLAVLLSLNTMAVNFTDIVPSIGTTWSIITGDTQAVAGHGYMINASGGEVNLTMPVPVMGVTVPVKALDNTNTIIIKRNGTELIEGLEGDLIMNISTAGFSLTYSDASHGWVIQNNIADLSVTSTSSLEEPTAITTATYAITSADNGKLLTNAGSVVDTVWTFDTIANLSADGPFQVKVINESVFLGYLTAYTNKMGTGNRTGDSPTNIGLYGLIVFKSNFSCGDTTAFINGANTNNVLNGAYETIAGKYITFDFGYPVCITEIRAMTSASHNNYLSGTAEPRTGMYQTQVSEDNVTWVNMGEPFAFTPDVDQYVTAISTNTTLHRWYRFLGIGPGTTGDGYYFGDFNFKIGTVPNCYSITLAPASGEKLIGKLAIDRTLKSSLTCDMIQLRTVGTGLTPIGVYPNGDNWVDTAQAQ